MFDRAWVEEVEAKANVADPVELARLRKLTEEQQKLVEEQQKRIKAEQQSVEEERLRAESEKRRAEEQNKANYRLRFLASIVSILALCAVLLGWQANKNANVAIERRIQGLSYQLSTQAKEVMTQNYQLAVLLAAQAFKFKDTPDARLALDQVLQLEPRFQRRFKDNDFFTVSSGAAISADGSLIAAAVGSAKQIYIWDTSSGKLLKFFTAQSFIPTQLAFSPDNKFLVATSFYGKHRKSIDADLLLWNLETDEKQWYSDFEKGIYTLAFSPDGRMLATSDVPDSFTHQVNDAPSKSAVAPSVITKTFQFKKLDLTLPEIEYQTDTWHFTVFNLPKGITMTQPYLIQCRESGDSDKLVENYLLLWPFENSMIEQLTNGHAKIMLKTKTGNIVSEDESEFNSADFNDVLIPNGRVLDAKGSKVNQFMLAFDKWEIRSGKDSNLSNPLKLQILSHGIYGNDNYPRHRFLLRIENTTGDKINNITIWGVVKNKYGKPIDVMVKWNGEYIAGFSGGQFNTDPLFPSFANYYQLISLSESGRCVATSDSQEDQLLELWVSYQDEAKQYHSAHDVFNIAGLRTEEVNGHKIIVVK